MKNILIKQFLLFNKHNENYHKEIINEQIMIYENYDNIDFNNSTINDLTQIKWIYDINNYRIPYTYVNIKITHIKLSPKDNIYDYISSNTIIPNTEIVSGENIQNLCDVVIGCPNKLNYNPNNKYFSSKMLNVYNENDLTNYKNIFVFTDNLLYFYEHNHENLNNKNIISHNSDHGINSEYIKYLDNINSQFSQNCVITHNKLFSIPIGIENRMWLNHDMFHNIRKSNIKKDKNIYFYFSLNTHPTRNKCYETLKDKLTWNTQKSKEDYFIELSRHKYAICPRGNGLDTHRLWECLYLDVIPIMIKDDLVNIDNLPIIVFDNWDEFDENKLNVEFSNIQNNKIFMNHYENLFLTT